VSKWRGRDFVKDASSRPRRIAYALNSLEKGLIMSLRTSTWMPLDQVHEAMRDVVSGISRTTVYRYMKSIGINRQPQEKRDRAKKFKDYKPGFLHIDVTYLPKFKGKARYLFVAIDRATRLMYYDVYDNKSAENAADFLERCREFFPMEITHVLTDNGLEFTNRLIVSRKGEPCRKLSKMDQKCRENDIEHRITKPPTPKTNGMVERVNGTIKTNTILRYTYKDQHQMKDNLMDFIAYYNLHRRHGALKKELGVKTPFLAIKEWYRIEPGLFNIDPVSFEQKLVNLYTKDELLHQQPHGT
jgi:transposase InsO family protein